MNEEQIKKEIISLFKEKQKIEKKIETLQNKLVQQLCPKGKQECEPEYCVFRLADTCPFLKKWREILEEAGVPKETGYDLLIDFLEKILKDKSLFERKK